MAQEFLLASGIIALQARGFNAIFAGMDRMRGAMGGVDRAHERMRDVQASSLEAMADRQRRLDDRVAGIREAADRADEARTARHRQRAFDLYAQMEGASPEKVDQIRRRIAAVHDRADADQADAAAKLTARTQQLHKAAAATEQAAAKQVAAGMAEATEAAEAAAAALPVAAFLALAAAIAAVAYAAFKLGEASLAAHDAAIELGNALMVEGDVATGASEKLQAHARALAEFANLSRVAVLGMETQTLRLGISADQAGRAVDIAVGLAKARGVDVETAVHAVDLAIMGREEQLRRLIGEKRGGTMSGDALLARASEIGQKGLTLRAADAVNTYTGAVERLSNRWQDLERAIGEAFGPLIIATVRGVTIAIEMLTGIVIDLGKIFVMVGHWLSETFIKPLSDLLGLSGAFKDALSVMKDGWQNFKNYVVYIWEEIWGHILMTWYKIEALVSHPIDAIRGKLAQDPRIAQIQADLDRKNIALSDAQIKIQESHAKALAKVPLRQERSLATASTFDAVSLATKIQESAFATADPHLAEAKKHTNLLERIATGVEAKNVGAGAAVVGP